MFRISRFRFSARLLLLAVAALGAGLGWVSYQLQWIRNRNQIISRGDVFNYGAVEWYMVDAPWPLDHFGEVGFVQLSIVKYDSDRANVATYGPRTGASSGGPTKVSHDFDRAKVAIPSRPWEDLLRPDECADLNRVRELFPEAEVFVWFLPENQQATLGRN